MSKTRRAAVMYGIDDIRVEDIAMPEKLDPGDVLSCFGAII